MTKFTPLDISNPRDNPLVETELDAEFCAIETGRGPAPDCSIVEATALLTDLHGYSRAIWLPYVRDE